MDLNTILDPSLTFDVRPYAKPGDSFFTEMSPSDVAATYSFKYRVALALRPAGVLEIGVRAGYSAAAFLTGRPGARFVGLDADVSRWGGSPGFFGYSQEMLRYRFGLENIDLRTWDTRHGLPPDLGTFDLAHVDGDHSEQGCLTDLRHVAPRARWILVDDMDHELGVRAAVKRFLKETDRAGTYFPTLRGDMLIEGDLA